VVAALVAGLARVSVKIWGGVRRPDRLVEWAELEAVADGGRIAHAKGRGEGERVAAGGLDLGQQPVHAQVLGGEAQLLEQLLDPAAGDWVSPPAVLWLTSR
jgi:hypothetical protein